MDNSNKESIKAPVIEGSLSDKIKYETLFDKYFECISDLDKRLDSDCNKVVNSFYKSFNKIIEKNIRDNVKE
jgi:hypothetical protein